MIWLEIDRVHFLRETGHDSLSAVHELSMRRDFFILPLLLLLIGTSGLFIGEEDPEPLALVGKLSKSVPVFDVARGEDGVAHL